MDEDFSFLQPLDLITKDVYQLRQMIKERKKNSQKDRDKDKEPESYKRKDKELEKEHEGERARVREKERQAREKEFEKDREGVEKNKKREKQHEDHNVRDMVTDQEVKVNVKHEENGASGGKFNHISEVKSPISL